MSIVDPVLRLRGISKKFGEIVVAADLSMDLLPGQALGIVGPNGAGKSTLFSMISGDLRPDTGVVELDGVDLTGRRAHERTRAGIGRTFQIPRPFEKMTVFENVLVFATVGGGRGKDAAFRFAAETLDRAGLGAHANEAAGALSLLARKRLEVARALATDPKVLLLDEVAGGLTDPEVAELVELIRSVNAEGLAIIWIEHVVHALTATVDRLACLAGGRMVADGDPLDVLADPIVRELYLGQAVMTEEDLT